MSAHDATRRAFEEQLAQAGPAVYELTLLVSGASDLSARAITNVNRLCEAHLRGRYALTVIDVNEDPSALPGSGVLAAPTLVKNLPLPVRRLVGDLSRTDQVLAALGLPSGQDADAPQA